MTENLGHNTLIKEITYENALNILKNISFKREPFYTGKGNIEATELLFYSEGINTVDFLETLKKNEETFILFSKMINFAFKEVKETNESFSINAFIKDLGNPNIFNEIEKYENEYNIDSSKIIIEILEYNYGILDKDIVANIKQLKKKGYKIAIDDYTINKIDEPDDKSVENLTILLINDIIPEYIKIDGKFLNKIFNNEIDDTQVKVLKYMIDILKEKGSKIVGEWIGSEEDGLKAKELGIDFFQGRDLNDNFKIEGKNNNKNEIFSIPEKYAQIVNQVLETKKSVA